MNVQELGIETNRNVVHRLEDYIAEFPHTKEMLVSNWKEEDSDEWNFTDQADSVLDILALDVVYYAKRRIPELCQSHGDRLRDIRRNLMNAYESRYGVTYEDPNENVEW